MSRAMQYEMVSNNIVHNITFLETMQICDRYFAAKNDSRWLPVLHRNKVCRLLTTIFLIYITMSLAYIHKVYIVKII